MATPSPSPVPTERFRLTGSDGLCIACARWGSRGAVGQKLRGLHILIGGYRDAGLRGIAFDFYRGGRHEMLNEVNRRQVQARLLGSPKRWEN